MVEPRALRPGRNDRPSPGVQRLQAAPRPRLVPVTTTPPIAVSVGFNPHSGETPRAAKPDEDQPGIPALLVEPGDAARLEAGGATAPAALSAPADPSPVPATSSIANGESVTLVDADGVIIELADPTTLRREFDRIFFEADLPPDQITRMWEFNASARGAIERHFGKEVLQRAQERIQRGDNARWQGVPPEVPGPAAQDAPTNGRALPGEPSQKTNGPAPPIGPPAIAFDRRWGDRKLFLYYRTHLAAVQRDRSAAPNEIARFRETNSAIEQRLRSKLPQLMRLIDVEFGQVPGPAPDAPIA